MAGRAAAKLQKVPCSWPFLMICSAALHWSVGMFLAQELKRLAKTPLPFCKIGPVEGMSKFPGFGNTCIYSLYILCRQHFIVARAD